MSWWRPWHRSSDDEAKREVLRAQQRLEESQELRRHAQEAERRLRRHLRRNRFGAMIERQVFGGGE